MRTILAGIVGSTAHGLAGPDSDQDRAEVVVEDSDKFLGLGKPFESAQYHEPDRTVHEVGKFLSLAMKGNPTVVELLWLPRHEFASHEGLALIKARDLFLTKSYVRACLGTANTMMRRQNVENRPEKAQRHALRVLVQTERAMRTNRIDVNLGDVNNVLIKAYSLQSFEDFSKVLSQQVTAVEGLLADCDWPDKCPLEPVNELLLGIRKGTIERHVAY